MQNKFAVFDIDGTIFRSSLVLEAVNVLLRKGVFKDSAREVFSTELEKWRTRSETDAYESYIEAVVRAFNKNITGVPSPLFESISEEVVEEQAAHTYVYTRDLIRTLKSEGYFMIAISGSPSELVSRFADKYGFDHFVSTEYTKKDGYFTNEVISAHKGKDVILKKIVTENNLTFKGSYGVGDTKGDASMLALVDHPIAFNPDRSLFESAKANGWQVIVERKNVVYKLQSKNGEMVLD